MIKLLRNNTSEDIIYINQTIEPGATLELEHTMWAKAIQNKTIFTLIEENKIIVNNGTRDLTVAEAIVHMNRLHDPRFNFSYNEINENILVASGQQMIVHETMELIDTLTLEGQVVLL